MKLISPYGVPVTASDEHGEFLIARCGFRRVDAVASPAAPVVADEKPAAPKRRRVTKDSPTS